MTFRTLISLFILFIAVLVVAFAPLPVQRPEPAGRTFRVQASSFEYTPAVLAVNQGDLVTIELTSSDVVHGLYLDGYDLEINADPGQTKSLTFIADRSGSFRFRCSVTCGELHPFMIGKLKVGQNSLLWRGIGLAFVAILAGIWSLRR
jgi:heme/copper-type cytochrome/quinol oxidase subunit 2